jgi:TolA-binding protein
MIRTIIAVIGTFVLFLGSAAAQETKESGLAAWLKDLQRKIELVAPKKSLPVTTGVAGVRGAKEDPKQKLDWKGKAGEDPVTEAELAEFKTGVELAAKGESDAALKELMEFMQQYPDSALIPDAKKTLDMVKAEQSDRK